MRVFETFVVMNSCHSDFKETRDKLYANFREAILCSDITKTDKPFVTSISVGDSAGYIEYLEALLEENHIDFDRTREAHNAP